MRLHDDASFTYRIDPDAGLALAQMEGRLTGKDMLRIVQAVHADPAWRPSFDAVWDCTRVSAHVVMPSDVGGILDETVEGAAGRDVLVESRSLGQSFFSKMLAFAARARGAEAHACHSVDEALGLLGRESLPDSLRSEGAEAR